MLNAAHPTRDESGASAIAKVIHTRARGSVAQVHDDRGNGLHNLRVPGAVTPAVVARTSPGACANDLQRPASKKMLLTLETTGARVAKLVCRTRWCTINDPNVHVGE